ncbi:hypothetical protein N7486_003255 [Penicillium sp. IBT 16267x]|nr:hypothetical protein N7486_003255 [Penicillium sp. IBT 16267x]
MLPFWRTDPHPLDNYRSSETLPGKSDIVIVGAGYAGSSVAYHILSQVEPGTKPPSITILEARQACSGATARNCKMASLSCPNLAHRAFFSSSNGGHMKPLDRFRCYGPWSRGGCRDRERFVEKEKVDCDYTVTKAIDVQLDADHFNKLMAGRDRLIAGGSAPTKEAQCVGPTEAETFSGVKGAVGCFTYDAGHTWAYKFVLLLQKVVAQGVNLQTHTAVSNISKSTVPASSYPWRVETPRGAVAAKKVVPYTSALAPQFKDKIVPVRGTCCRIAIPPTSTAPRLTNTYTLRWGGWDYDYLIPRGDGSIVVGGARSSFIDQLDHWYDVSDDSRLLESAVRYFDGYMQRNFVDWEDSHAYTDRTATCWSGPWRGRTVHPGGSTGQGMPQVFLAAEGIAKMIVGGAKFEETGLPRLFQTSQARLGKQENKIFDHNPQGSTQAKL